MQTIEFNLPGRAPVAFDVGASSLESPSTDTSYMILGVRKCGSSLVNSMLESLAKINRRNYLDVGGTFFKHGVPEREWIDRTALAALLAPGTLYGGFRSMPTGFLGADAFVCARKILLVRDPRDALVSEYFTVAYSHSVPEPNSDKPGAREELLAARERARLSDITAFVLKNAVNLNRTMMDYHAIIGDPLLKLYRYEDVILEKRLWLASMAEHFGWDGGSPGFIDGMMSWADKVPDKEDPQAFVRKVLPGDHKDKLSSAVIAQLDEALAPSMRLFGYD